MTQYDHGLGMSLKKISLLHKILRMMRIFRGQQCNNSWTTLVNKYVNKHD